MQVAESAATYVAGGDFYRYPELGDPLPPGGADVQLLTKGGICVRGKWNNSGAFLGWAPMPKRDHNKEKLLIQQVYG